MRKKLALVLGVAAVALIVRGCSSSPPPDEAKNKPTLTPASAPSADEKISWVEWSDAAFERARAENKLVILHLGAVWCHWCHVMEHETYSNPEVIAVIKKSFIAVYVDQDARPDLSNRYEDYGWPATIIFDGKGQELVKRRGFIPPKPFLSLLEAVVADPTPGPSVTNVRDPGIVAASAGALAPEIRDELNARYRGRFDPKLGAWGTVHKYLDPDAVELALRRMMTDPNYEPMAKLTLTNTAKHLIDPVWGGVYQYSDSGDKGPDVGSWESPHFEKIMAYQAGDLRIFALAHAQLGDAESLKAARDIDKFLAGFLTSPEGAFYTSQDADIIKGEHAAEYFKLDDASRRAKGIPTIDKHVYARENGWAIEALCQLYAVTGDQTVLDRALKAVEYVIANRGLPGGGFRHDGVPASGDDVEKKYGPYLGDTLAMGRAFLALQQVTGEKKWLDKALEAAKFIDAKFRVEPAGYSTVACETCGTAAAPKGTPAIMGPKPQVDENIALVRWSNLLHHVAAEAEGGATKKMAEHAMKYLAAPAIAKDRGPNPGTLLADMEIASEPVHVTVIGPRSDERARALFSAAIKLPSSYKNVEWVESASGDLPKLDKPAAFVCAGGACSPPVFEPAAIREKAERFGKARE